MKRQPTPEKPLVSPRLVWSYRRHSLNVKLSGRMALCISSLDEVIDMPEDGVSFWIELSSTQWNDRSGSEVWLWWCRECGGWLWDYENQSYIFDGFVRSANAFLTRHLEQHDKPTRYFFRLVYE